MIFPKYCQDHLVVRGGVRVWKIIFHLSIVSISIFMYLFNMCLGVGLIM